MLVIAAFGRLPARTEATAARPVPHDSGLAPHTAADAPLAEEGASSRRHAARLLDELLAATAELGDDDAGDDDAERDASAAALDDTLAELTARLRARLHADDAASPFARLFDVFVDAGLPSSLARAGLDADDDDADARDADDADARAARAREPYADADALVRQLATLAAGLSAFEFEQALRAGMPGGLGTHGGLGTLASLFARRRMGGEVDGAADADDDDDPAADGARAEPPLAWHPLVRAALGGHVEAVRAALAPGASALPAGALELALTMAVQSGSGRGLVAARALLDAGADPNVPAPGFEDDDSLPLCLAVLRADVPAVRLLASQGADVNLRSGRGRTPLHLAVIGGDGSVLAALLAMAKGTGAGKLRLEEGDAHGVTALITAVVNGDEAAAVQLLAAGARTRATLLIRSDLVALNQQTRAQTLKAEGGELLYETIAVNAVELALAGGSRAHAQIALILDAHACAPIVALLAALDRLADQALDVARRLAGGAPDDARGAPAEAPARHRFTQLTALSGSLVLGTAGSLRQLGALGAAAAAVLAALTLLHAAIDEAARARVAGRAGRAAGRVPAARRPAAGTAAGAAAGVAAGVVAAGGLVLARLLACCEACVRLLCSSALINLVLIHAKLTEWLRHGVHAAARGDAAAAAAADADAAEAYVFGFGCVEGSRACVFALLLLGDSFAAMARHTLLRALALGHAHALDARAPRRCAGGAATAAAASAELARLTPLRRRALCLCACSLVGSGAYGVLHLRLLALLASAMGSWHGEVWLLNMAVLMHQGTQPSLQLVTHAARTCKAALALGADELESLRTRRGPVPAAAVPGPEGGAAAAEARALSSSDDDDDDDDADDARARAEDALLLGGGADDEGGRGPAAWLVPLASALISASMLVAIVCSLLGSRARVRSSLVRAQPWGLSGFILAGLVSGLVGDVRKLRAHAATQRRLAALRRASVAELAAFRAGGDVCCVCLSGVRRAAASCVLRCGHIFHSRCVAQWLCKGRPVCPHCLAPVVDDARAPTRAPPPRADEQPQPQPQPPAPAPPPAPGAIARAIVALPPEAPPAAQPAQASAAPSAVEAASSGSIQEVALARLALTLGVDICALTGSVDVRTADRLRALEADARRAIARDAAARTRTEAEAATSVDAAAGAASDGAAGSGRPWATPTGHEGRLAGADWYCNGEDVLR